MTIDSTSLITDAMLEGINKFRDYYIDSIKNIVEISPDEASKSDIESNIESEKILLKNKYPTYEKLLDAFAEKQAIRSVILKKQRKAIQEAINTISGRMGPLLSLLEEIHEDHQDNQNEADLEKLKNLEFDEGEFLEIAERMALDSSQLLKTVSILQARRETKETLSVNGAEGAKARADKYTPLKEKAFEMARNGGFRSAHQAAIAITPAILAMPEAANNGMSKDRAAQTIAGWLRKERLFPKKSD